VSTSQQTEGADVHLRRWTGGGSRQDKMVQYHQGSGTPENITETGSSPDCRLEAELAMSI